MIDRDQIVSEDELNAYVDGELPADRRGAVEAWLATHPDDAAKVAAWRKQAELIRARYGAVADEKPPQRLDVGRLTRRRYGAMAAAAAAVVAAFLVGGVAGWTVARRRSGVALRSHALHHRRARCLPALRGRGPPSGRGAGRPAAASGGMAVEAGRLAVACARTRQDGIEARRRPAAAGADRSDGVLHV